MKKGKDSVQSRLSRSVRAAAATSLAAAWLIADPGHALGQERAGGQQQAAAGQQQAAGQAQAGGQQQTAGQAQVRTAAGRVRAREWWLGEMDVRQAWRTGTGAGVVVAVLSDGVAAAQRDLAGSVISGRDFAGSAHVTGAPQFGALGTAIASLIAGHGHGRGRADGVVGVAPAATILSVRVMPASGGLVVADPAASARLPAAIARGIRYAVGRGASIIDLPMAAVQTAASTSPATTPAVTAVSAGGSPAEAAAVRYARRHGVVLVAPGGDNAASSGAHYPAAYPGVIAVGALGRELRTAAFSSWQPYITVAAPGVGVVAASVTRRYQTLSSTSAASAIVAGVIALVRSDFPKLTPAQVTAALTNTALTNPGTSQPGGLAHGRKLAVVNAVRALTSAARLESAAAHQAAGIAGRRVVPAANGMAHRLLRYAVLAAGVSILLLALIIGYLAARRRRLRRDPAGTAPWPAPVSAGYAAAQPTAEPATAPLSAIAGAPPAGTSEPHRTSAAVRIRDPAGPVTTARAGNAEWAMLPELLPLAGAPPAGPPHAAAFAAAPTATAPPATEPHATAPTATAPTATALPATAGFAAAPPAGAPPAIAPAPPAAVPPATAPAAAAPSTGAPAAMAPLGAESEAAVSAGSLYPPFSAAPATPPQVSGRPPWDPAPPPGGVLHWAHQPAARRVSPAVAPQQRSAEPPWARAVAPDASARAASARAGAVALGQARFGGGPRSIPDTPAPDAHGLDIRTPDSPASDARTLDTRTLDTRTPDAGTPDAGAPESGALESTGAPESTAQLSSRSSYWNPTAATTGFPPLPGRD